MSAFLSPSSAPFHFTAEPLPEAVLAKMRGVSWKDDPRCPAPADLAFLRITHLTFEAAPALGELVVAADLVPRTRALFARLWQLGFPLRSMRLIEEYGASDDASMVVDNFFTFNFRLIAGMRLISQHALGRAIDLNPRENPWLRRPDAVEPPDGQAFLDRRDVRPGMIVRPGPVTALFDELGWEWGGDWPRPDYHHIMKAKR